VLDLSTCKTFVSRNVVFYESTFPPIPSLTQNNVSQLRRSERTKHPPNYLKQYYCGNMAQIPSADPSFSDCSLPGKPYSIFSFLSNSKLSLQQRAFTSSVSSVFEPMTYKQASSIPHWQHVMTNEIITLEQNRT